MSEIKVLFSAQTGCMSPKTVCPGISPCILYNWPKKTSTHQVHTCENCSPSSGNVHLAMEMCESGTVRILNFGHCLPSVRLTVPMLGPCHKHVRPISIISCFLHISSSHLSYRGQIISIQHAYNDICSSSLLISVLNLSLSNKGRRQNTMTAAPIFIYCSSSYEI